MDKHPKMKRTVAVSSQRQESGAFTNGADFDGVEGGGARILIVDDDRSMLEVLSAILSTVGFSVSVAGGSKEAISLLVGEPFDLVFTDLNMPYMDGWSLASFIKDRSPDTPVVLVTGELEADVRGKLKGSCADNALFKPFSMTEVLRTANQMLEKRWNIGVPGGPEAPLPV